MSKRASMPPDVRIAFSKRLNTLMAEKGLRKSSLARRIWGTTIDPRTGYAVAKNRDRISSWTNARQIPDPVNLVLLARELEVDPDELLPLSKLTMRWVETPLIMEDPQKPAAALAVATLALDLIASGGLPPDMMQAAARRALDLISAGQQPSG